MTCQGCAKAVTAMLKKVEGTCATWMSQMLLSYRRFCMIESAPASDTLFLPSARFLGVQDIQCDVDKKVVTVTGTATTNDMLAAIQKTGKAASLVA